MNINIDPVKVYGILMVVFGVILVRMLYQRWFFRLKRAKQFAIMSARYHFYYNFIPTRSMFKRISERIAALSVYNYMEIRYQSVAFFETALKQATLVFLVVLFGFGDLLSAVLAGLYAIIVIQTSINKSLDRTNSRIIESLSITLGRIREAYIRTRSIPEALSSINVPAILESQINEIHSMLTTVDGKGQLSRFCEKTPNRIMRTLATTCYLRNDSGDDGINEGGVTFTDALALIKDEVDAERIRLFNQRVMFQSLDKLPWIPLLAYPVIVWAYEHIIPATQGVFDGFWGYIIKIVVMLTSLICYYILSTINNSSAAAVDDRIHTYAELHARNGWRKFADTLVPHNYKKYRKLKDSLSHCLSSKTPSYFYLEKFLNMCIFTVASIIMSIFIVYMSKNAVYHSVQAASMMSTMEINEYQKEALFEYDKKILAGPPPTDADTDRMTRELQQIMPNATDLDLESQVDRVKQKYTTYTNLHFWWWFALIYVGAGIAGWFSSNLLLKLRMSMVNDEAMRDVLQLQTVIAILMDTQLDTFDIVYWLMRSADIHRYALTECFNEYPSNPERAIKHMGFNASVPEFLSICDKLKETVYNITMFDAFSDLVKDRQSIMKMREIAQNEELKRKRMQASPIAKIPMFVWMMTCFILPIIIVTVNSATTLIAKLGDTLG